MNFRTLVYFACMLLPSWSPAQVAASAKESLHTMEWLLGTWTRTNVKPGRTAWEQWSKKNESEWTGLGVSMKGADTSFVEVLKIIIEKEKLFYVADVPENKSLVYFEISSVAKDGFVCENPTHDFPKKLVYQLNGSKLRAQISGDGKVIDYLFERKVH